MAVRDLSGGSASKLAARLLLELPRVLASEPVKTTLAVLGALALATTSAAAATPRTEVSGKAHVEAELSYAVQKTRFGLPSVTDCSDFRTQAEAQRWLLPGDPHRLDDDRDGVACERLP